MRLKTKFAEAIAQVHAQLEQLEQQQDIDIDMVQEVLQLSGNIYQAYVTAPYELKRFYLGLFWDKFVIANKQIITALPTSLIQALQEEKKVILGSDWQPSPLLTRTLESQEYMTGLRAKMATIISIRQQVYNCQ